MQAFHSSKDKLLKCPVTFNPTPGKKVDAHFFLPDISKSKQVSENQIPIPEIETRFLKSSQGNTIQFGWVAVFSTYDFSGDYSDRKK